MGGLIPWSEESGNRIGNCSSTCVQSDDFCEANSHFSCYLGTMKYLNYLPE